MQELIHALGIEWKIIIAQIINFTILLFILAKFVYNPVMRLLDERREGVKKTLENEEKAAAKLASAETDKDAILKEARAESSRIIETARVDAEEQKRRMVAATNVEVVKMHAEGQKKLKEEKSRLLVEVKGEIGTLIVATIEKTLGDVLDARTQGKMVEQALAAIRETNGHTHNK